MPAEHIVSWSFSKLSDFEKCKRYAKLKHLDRIPEPERALKPGQTEHANDRGSRIHDAAEQYVRGTGPFIHELASFQPEFERLRALYQEGKVSLEGEWGMDEDWEPAPWKTAWHRSKLDSIVHLDRTSAIVIDYKTGRKFGNELKHGQQVQLYTLNALLRYPELEEVTTELWYTDQNEITSMTFRRDQGLRFKANFHRRGVALTTNNEWPPNPNRFSCQWCQYGPWAGGQCPDGVR
jgi:hypothetical protein